jgi:hypothetical protein
MKAQDARRVKELERENRRLERIVADPGASTSSCWALEERFVTERRACRVVGQPRSTQRLAPPVSMVRTDVKRIRAALPALQLFDP